MNDKTEALEGGRDEYAELLARLGRSEEMDHRVSVHEAGHVVAARLLGHPLGGATIDPGDRYEGRVWGERHKEALAQGRGDAAHIREALAPTMPKPGEDGRTVSDIFANIYGQCVELMAGRAAERILLDEELAGHSDDLRQARELAMLISKSEEAIDTFIKHCDVAARDLLMPYGDLLMALSILLRIKRTLHGAEIDRIIWEFEAHKALAIERARRRQWQRAVDGAAQFKSHKRRT